MTDRALTYRLAWSVIGLSLMIAACGGPPLADQDRIATRVAEDRAVAATLTAEAPKVAPTATEIAQVLPTQAPTVAPTDVVAPTDTLAPTETDRPTIPPQPTPQPSPTIVPIVPGFGNTNGLNGQILLPGYSGPLDEPVFSARIVFRMIVSDPAAGNVDGAGINSVDFSIDAPTGNRVHTRTENVAGYCAFGGGEPTCEVWVFADHNNAWPDGTAVCAGSGYQANIDVHAKDPQKDGASWHFNFEVTGNYPLCNP